MDDFKFNLGDIVRHGATKSHSGTPMLVIARGRMEYKSFTENIYHLSLERSMSMDDRIVRYVLAEYELTSHETPKPNQ